MPSKSYRISLLILGLVLANAAVAADKGLTTIEIPKLHCAHCAKKIQQGLSKVANVASATVDLKAKSATIQPGKGKAVSGKLLWEAVEAAGYKPAKLINADGTHTSKPKA